MEISELIHIFFAGYGAQGIAPMGVLGPSTPRFDMNDFPALGDSASPPDMAPKAGGMFQT